MTIEQCTKEIRLIRQGMRRHPMSDTFSAKAMELNALVHGRDMYNEEKAVEAAERKRDYIQGYKKQQKHVTNRGMINQDLERYTGVDAIAHMLLDPTDYEVAESLSRAMQHPSNGGRTKIKGEVIRYE